MVKVIKNIVKFFNYPGRILAPDTDQAMKIYRLIVFVFHPLEIIRRVFLAQKLRQVSPVIVNGYGVTSLSDGLIKLLHSVKEKIVIAELENDGTRKKAFLKTYSQSIDDLTIRKISTSPEIVHPVASYLGSWPVLADASIWYSNAKTVEPGRSQQFHRDGGDLRQVKVFLPLAEVTEHRGPFTLIGEDVSRKIYENLSGENTSYRRNTKIPDEKILSFVPESDWVKMLGDLGTAFFCDTTACYHFGSRPGRGFRLLLMLHYYSYGSTEIPLFYNRSSGHELSFRREVEDQLLLGPYSSMFSKIKSGSLSDVYRWR